jgi:hypothetical protein
MQFTLDKNIQVLRWAFVKQATKVVDGILIAEFPFLATPVLKQLMDAGLSYVIGKLANEAEMLAFFAYTDLRVNEQGRSFIAAAAKHQEILKSGTPEEKAQSEADLFHNFRQLAMVKG